MFLQIFETKIAIIKLFLSSTIFITAFSSGKCYDHIDESEDTNYRLQSHVVPRHYSIHIHIWMRDMITLTNITIEILKATTDINLHMLHLDIYYAYTTLINEHGIAYKPAQQTYELQTHILNLHFNNEILRGLYSLNMRHIRRFSGTENERGFLKFSFLTEKPRIM
ncbi:hypothetical protein HN011_007109 [Eciton burchellii]|nr:hypothetical protein HN011_007109 [Eciton burchellii]